MTTSHKPTFRAQYSRILRLHPQLFTFDERKELRAIFTHHYDKFPAEGTAPGNGGFASGGTFGKAKKLLVKLIELLDPATHTTTV